MGQLGAAGTSLDILVADADGRWAELVGGLLAADGMTLRHAGDATALQRAITRKAPDVILCDVDLPGGGAVAALPGQRGEAAVILLSGRGTADPSVVTAAGQLGALHVLRKPVSLLDLTDLLRGIARRRAPRALPTGGPPAPDAGRLQRRERNLGLMVRILAEGLSGDIELDEGQVPVRVSVGGLLEGRAADRLAAGLTSSLWSLSPRASTGRGDVGALAGLVWSLARDPGQGRFAADRRLELLSRTPFTELLFVLPVHDGLRGALISVDGRHALGETLAAGGLALEACSVDLHALVRLRVVELRPALGVSARPTSPPLSARMPLAVETPAAGADRSDHVGRREAHNSDHVGRSDLRSRSEPSASGPRSDIRSLHGRPVDVIALQQRLRKEIEQLRDAPAAVVLGIPANANAELAEAAVERLRKRYRDIADSPTLPGALRQLAGEMLAIVEGAFHRFARSRADELRQRRAVERAEDFEAAPATEEDLAVEKAEGLFAKGAFPEADRLLSRAHQKRIDHVGVIACLGWARLHNGHIEAHKREEEARELLLLAEQLDPVHPRGQRYLSELLRRRGDLPAALRRAQRALKAAPEDADAQRLVRELRASSGP